MISIEVRLFYRREVVRIWRPARASHPRSSPRRWRCGSPPTPDEDYRFARRVGQKYGGTDFRSADRPGESRVGVVLRPVRVNVTDLRTPSGQ